MIRQAIISVLAALLIGELIKVIMQLVNNEPIKVFGMGGMPSTHAASVTALVLATYFETGISLTLLICCVFGIIVIRDAYSLRWEVSRHSQALNKFLKTKSFLRVGHKSLEVFAGVVLGLIVTAIVYWLKI